MNKNAQTNNYTVYHLHSDLSNGVTNIDSVTKYFEYIDYAKSLDMKAMAFSEHGCVYEWVHKKQKIESAGMKYIHAEEFYITQTLEEKIRDNYHCVLIAKNYDGVKELNQLSSKAFDRNDRHFYYNPRITIDELLNTSDNIIVTSACLGGILNNGNDKIKKKFLGFLIKNKHRCYLEIQHHIDLQQIKYNQYLYELSQKYDIPLIAGTDTHALNDRHMLGRSILQKSKGVKFDNEDTWDMTFKTYDELVECYRKQNSLPIEVCLEAIQNTNVMADSIETFELDYNKKYPKLYADSKKELNKKIVKGVQWRGINKLPNYKEYKDKILYELKTYEHNDAIDFLLLEEDYKTALRNQGVAFGYSRGSVSGSIIAYLLGITEVDSIKYKLNFERFMSSERVSLADVDTDWFKEDRGKVREYLFQKEGLYCCDIITFNTIALKGAIKDVGRALGLSLETTQALSDACYLDGKKWAIDNKYRKQYPELFEYTDIVEGVIVSVGNHPAGLVVSPHDVTTAFATFTSPTNKYPISQINMKEIDSLNYVKLDVLGLDAVGLINKTCDMANIPRLTPDNTNLNDEAVWNDIKKDCTLIFQFESSTAEAYLKQLLSDETLNNIRKVNPNASYIDLMSMANGAIRPAGASYRDELSKGIYRDNGHKALNDFLAPTLGYLVYQEQVMEFLHSFCGYTMGEADIVRRGFAKKTGTEKFIPQIKEGFTKTMQDKYNVSKEQSDLLITNFIKVIEDASSYLFSKNHADPYTFIGYMCGYLRHYYPLEFLTTALNIYKEDNEKSKKIKEYVKQQGIKIKPIKFGKSLSEYALDKSDNSIYQGIASIKFCNAQIANELFELSKNHYNNFPELLDDIEHKTSVESRQLKILTTLNYFSDFGKNKKLLDIIQLYDNLSGRSQINKGDIDKLGINIDVFLKYVGSETEKQYRKFNMDGYIKEIADSMPNQCLSVKEQIQAELDYLKSIEYVNPKAPESLYYVSEFKTYKDVCKPYVTLYQLKTGNQIKSKVTSSSDFAAAPFKKGNVLKAAFREQNKSIKVDGVWKKSNEKELVLSDWQVY